MTSSLRNLVKRAIVWSGRAPLLERGLRAIGAHEMAIKVGRPHAEAFADVALPSTAASAPARRIRMHRIGDRDQVARALAANGWNGFERPLPSAVAAFARRWPGTFLDVGANTGLYSLIAAASADHTTAIAFEPVPEIVELLRANLALNRCAQRVVVDEVAIGDASGTAVLHLPPPQPDGTIETSASLEPDFKEEIDRFFEVRTSTLDDAWRQHGRPPVVMVKIDVEGSEARVLAGARELIDACRPIISVEVLPRVDPGPLEVLRAELGYVAVALAPDEATVNLPCVAVDPGAPNQLLCPPERVAEVITDLQGIDDLTVRVLPPLAGDDPVAPAQQGNEQRTTAAAPLDPAAALLDALEAADAAYHDMHAVAERLEAELEGYRTWVPPGHFYSPIPDRAEAAADRERIWGGDRSTCPGIDLALERQRALLDDLMPYYAELPFGAERQDGARYWLDNPWFPSTNGVLAYLLLCHLRPRRYVEVGSGFSSALVLDLNDRHLDGSLRATFIEPFPGRLRELLRPTDEGRVTIVESRVQDVDLDVFDQLEADDVLFIDSAHVSRVGSDVNHLVFEVLPRLRPGVVVHIHDVLERFEYPPQWIEEGRAWNEAYLIRAFLQFNDAFEILLWDSALLADGEDLAARFPLASNLVAGSLWLRRRPPPSAASTP